jgi:hypothetical protein
MRVVALLAWPSHILNRGDVHLVVERVGRCARPQQRVRADLEAKRRRQAADSLADAVGCDRLGGTLCAAVTEKVPGLN